MDCELRLAQASFIAFYLLPLIVSFHSHHWHSENVENCLPSVSSSTALWVCVVFPLLLQWGEAVVLVHKTVWASKVTALLVLSKWELKYWQHSFTQYLCSLHTEAEWVWMSLKLDSVVTTRVHQSPSYFRSLTVSGMPGGAVIFTSYRMIYDLSRVIQTVGFKGETHITWPHHFLPF